MAGYKLTADADADFSAIYAYSLQTFGEIQADRYSTDLITHFELIGDNPLIGFDHSRIKPGARALVHASHVIYYRLSDTGVIIFRILHHSQDPLRRL